MKGGGDSIGAPQALQRVYNNIGSCSEQCWVNHLIWLRGPYLHNGSVPNLRDLLESVEKRASLFYRGYDVYDPKNVGFVTQGLTAERFGWRFDTSVRGNGNKGHEYGTDLPPQEKEALLEHLKML